jgi:hypothetical protein
VAGAESVAHVELEDCPEAMGKNRRADRGDSGSNLCHEVISGIWTDQEATQEPRGRPELCEPGERQQCEGPRDWGDDERVTQDETPEVRRSGRNGLDGDGARERLRHDNERVTGRQVTPHCLRQLVIADRDVARVGDDLGVDPSRGRLHEAGEQCARAVEARKQEGLEWSVIHEVLLARAQRLMQTDIRRRNT